MLGGMPRKPKADSDKLAYPITAMISKAEYEEIVRRADRDQVSMSAIVRQLIRKALRSNDD